MKVFIVVSNYLGPHDLILKVFLSREKAEEWLGDNDNCSIIEKEISR